MNIINQFSWRRLGLLIKSDLVINSSKIFSFGLTIFMVLFLYSLIFLDVTGDSFYPMAFVLVLYSGGLWLTSRSFGDLCDREKSKNFLLLPASNLEKLLGRLLLTTIGYFIGIVLIFYIVSLLVFIFSWIFFGKTTVIFRLVCEDIMRHLVNYIFYQSLFFLGAIYFKSSNFSKTVLYLSCLMLGFFLVTSIIFLDFFWFDFLTKTTQLIFTVMVPLCAWLIAYLRLCESEI